MMTYSMELTFLWKGLILGFAVAAPVGPIGLLCIGRSLALGPRHGFATGLGAAAADTFYGIVAGFGLTAISNVLISQRFWIHLIGGLFLLYIGAKTFLSEPGSKQAEAESSTLIGSFLSALFLTVTNPMTILSFVAAFAGLGLADANGNYVAACALVGGVFIGSTAWWLILSSISGLFRKKVTPSALVWVNRVSGAVILALALVALASLLQ